MQLAAFGLFHDEEHAPPITLNHVVRVEIPLEAPDGQQYTVILLDADDSFDVVIQYPNTEREAVFSLVKEATGT